MLNDQTQILKVCLRRPLQKLVRLLAFSAIICFFLEFYSLSVMVFCFVFAFDKLAKHINLYHAESQSKCFLLAIVLKVNEKISCEQRMQ